MESTLTGIKKIGVIGAGVSSLSFLHCFKAGEKYSVDLFERSRVLAGRAATRKEENLIFDNGANYIFSNDERVINTLTNILPNDELITIEKWMYPFYKNNTIDFDKTKAEPHNQLAKYNYKSGISHLGKLLYESVNLEKFNCFFSQNVEKISEVDKSKWEVKTKDKSYGPYDYLVFGTPPKNIINILKNSEGFENSEFLVNEMSKVSYRKIYSFAVAFEGEFDFDFYALINPDREHPISWVSVENEKAGHVGVYKEKNVTLLIVQMGDQFSSSYSGESLDKVTELILSEVTSLLPQLKSAPVAYSNLKLWSLALPNNGLGKEVVDQLRDKNIFLIGDGVEGKGKVDQAMLSGFSLYDFFSAKF